MKPNLRKIAGLWYCRCEQVTGLGYTPNDAYGDWAKLLLNMWRQG